MAQGRPQPAPRGQARRTFVAVRVQQPAQLLRRALRQRARARRTAAAARADTERARGGRQQRQQR